ncbi:mechanosensitive ion channel [Shewanella sp. AS16]|uniref:mechanosensitive ion channel family protein n=1 Tax=Shewanella sp. AS16 TaxID=2907625 RepID=UPI001F43D96B|nr:mechanosensitive ion channel domain-containing protein [Shewanella sp. AS16]MCE9687462.1 mechanosensitive ion channel [Shewanella sp. AS16]
MSLDTIREWLAYVIFSYDQRPITVMQLLQVPLYLLLAWFIITRLGKWIKKALVARHVSADAVHLFSRVYLVVALALVIVTSLELLNIPLTAFAFVSGAIAIGVGFGAQNIINNFISGWILMWERPIRIGDFLEVGTARGMVESINTRSTLIRRNDGVHLLVPNSQLLENTVTNWTLIDNNVRTSVRVGVAYGSDVVLVASLLRQVMDEREDIVLKHRSNVYFDDFGDNALIFEIVFWLLAHSETDIRRLRSELRFRLCELLQQHHISIAFPQRDLHLDGALLLKREAKGEARRAAQREESQEGKP